MIKGTKTIAYQGRRSSFHLTKENININKSKLHKLVKHYFAEGEIPKIEDTEYQHYDSRSGCLYFSYLPILRKRK